MPYKDPKKNAECKRRWAEANRDYKCATTRRRYRARKKFEPEKHTERMRQKSLNNACRKLSQELPYDYQHIEQWYEVTHNEQNGRCAICGAFDRELTKRLCIDHNHKTGKLRGLLCNRCNIGIGMFDDNPSLCHQAKKYLKKHKE